LKKVLINKEKNFAIREKKLLNINEEQQLKQQKRRKDISIEIEIRSTTIYKGKKEKNRRKNT
jgi:hypothetical protein